MNSVVQLDGAKILVVDDIAENRELLSDTLEPEGYRISIAPNGEVALKVAQANPPDLILLDLMMPGMNGFEVCQRLAQLEMTQAIPIVFITAVSDTSSLVEGFRVGAVDYITKPFKAEEVLIRVRTHLTNHRLTQAYKEKVQELQESNARMREEMQRRQTAEISLELADAALSLISEQEAKRWGLEAFIGRGQAMHEMIEGIRKLQDVDSASVLIRGESGTGKELVARALHHSGRRRDKRFIAVNCAAIPTELAESLFFGHVKGAFSGANQSRKGYLELADGGTLFLDEIGDMPLSLQAKLLRALEDGSIMPVGSADEKRFNVRFLSATNVDLKERIDRGEFRQDLYFRIASYVFELKPLRERKEDIDLFVTHFIHRLSEERSIDPPSLSKKARQALMDHPFPGNVRELKSIIERALIESRGQTIEPCHLLLVNPERRPSPLTDPANDNNLAESLPYNLEQAEVELVRRAMEKENGNVSKAAQLMGINRTKIYRILSHSNPE